MLFSGPLMSIGVCSEPMLKCAASGVQLVVDRLVAQIDRARAQTRPRRVRGRIGRNEAYFSLAYAPFVDAKRSYKAVGGRRARREAYRENTSYRRE